MSNYLLSLTKKQLQITSLALDLFSRLESGQLERCFNMIPWKEKDLRDDEVRKHLSELQLLLIGFNNGNLGIGQVSDNAKIGFDLHQVIRHHLAWEREPSGGITVDFGTPLHEGSEPLAKIETCVDET